MQKTIKLTFICRFMWRCAFRKKRPCFFGGTYHEAIRSLQTHGLPVRAVVGELQRKPELILMFGFGRGD